MQENNSNLTIKEDANYIYNAGIAYISLPSDIDRDRYIRECYRTSTVSIFSEHNGFHNRVPIDRNTLNFIEFPEEIKLFGSAVVFVADPVRKRPIIVGLLNKTDELSGLQESQFSFKRELNGNVVQITGSPDGKYLHLSVIADSNGEIGIKVQSKDKSASVNIDVEGSLKVNAATSCSFHQAKEFSSVTTAYDGESTTIFKQDAASHTFIDDEHLIYTGKLSVNDGDQPIILGKAWADFMKSFIAEVGSSTVQTSMGLFPLLNAEKISVYQNKVDVLLSQVSFIDK